LAQQVVIAPEGELDLARVSEFRNELYQAAGEAAPRLVVDLSSVSFIDSSALGAIVDVQNRLRRDQRQLAVVAPEGTAVAVMLTLAGFRARLPVFETREAALEDAPRRRQSRQNR
jgi:anti-anti-sigma factor